MCVGHKISNHIVCPKYTIMQWLRVGVIILDFLTLIIKVMVWVLYSRYR
jgi:hypothetical protein